MPGWAQAIGTGTKLLGNIIGGAQARGGVKRAGTTLYQGANREAENALLMPETINPAISEAYRVAGQDLSTVANRSGDTVEQRAQQGAEGATNAATGANEYLNPYIQGGGRAFQTLSDLAMAPEERFTGTNLEMDPGYQFRQAEAQKAIERSAAARGIGQTGGTLKALTRYGQDMASQEYANAFDRSLKTFGANQQSRQQRLGTLSGLANIGYGASGAAGGNLINAAQYGGNLGMQGATTAGGWRNNAAQQQGNWGVDSANRQADIAMRYGDVARNLRLTGDQAMANSILGSAAITGDMWSGAGTSLGDFISSNPFSKSGSRGQGGPNSTWDASGYYNPWVTR